MNPSRMPGQDNDVSVGMVKYLFLALLIFPGLGALVTAFSRGPAGRGPDSFGSLLAFGAVCLSIAGFWIYWDHKTRVRTPEDELEQLLFTVARKFRRTRSLQDIVDEYRAHGATDDTLMFIRGAPLMLQQRGEKKIQSGYTLLATGVTMFVIGLAVPKSIAHHGLVGGIAAMGGGFGFMIQGFRQKKAFR
jgi:hypothetical protein